MGEDITVSGTNPPNPIYGTYTMTATSAVCGVAVGHGGYYILCGYSVGNCPVAQITDEDLSKIVSATSPPQSPTPWVVGAQKNLMVASTGGVDGPYSTKMLQWQLPPNIVAGYNFGSVPQLPPSPVPSSASQQANLQYYWTSGDNVNAQNFSTQMELTSTNEEAVPIAYVSYLVETPTVEPSVTLNPVTITHYAAPSPSVNSYLSRGSQQNLPTSAGYQISYHATMPTIPQAKGYIGLAQVIPKDSSPATAVPYLDGCPINNNTFSGGQVIYHGPPVINAGASGSAPYFDAPNNGLSDADSPFTASTNFLDYLMYRPVGKSSIWVALGTVSWNYGGTATYKPSPSPTWVLSAPSTSAPVISQVPPQSEPTWTAQATGGVVCPSLPTQ